MKEQEGSICEGCGRRVGAMGCCQTISRLEAEVAVYRFALQRIADMAGKTMLGECCDRGACSATLPAEACAFQHGANQAFNRAARVAAESLRPLADDARAPLYMEAVL